MERQKLESSRDRREVDLEITPEASLRLKTLILRPNPTLAEFGFLCIGQINIIDKILTASESYSKASGISQKGLSQVDTEEFKSLGMQLSKQIEKVDFIVFGHSHPSGSAKIGNSARKIIPGDYLLIPSMGNPEKGGSLFKYDLWAARLMYKTIPSSALFFGIAANTFDGPKLRIYNTMELSKIKRRNDINYVPQITINL